MRNDAPVIVDQTAAARRPAPERVADLRVFHVTGRFAGPEDLAERVGQRLHELAADALAPWVKLDELVFRADEILDAGEAITIVARVGDEIGRRLAALRDQQWGRPRVSLSYSERVVQGELAKLRRSVRAAGASETTIELGRVEPRRVESLRAGTAGFLPDELIEFGLKHLFLGEPLPQSLGVLSGMTDPGIDQEALREAFALPDGVAEPVARLVVSEGLVSHGHASAVTRFTLGPRSGAARRIKLESEEPRVYSNVTPGRRRLEGLWRV